MLSSFSSTVTRSSDSRKFWQGLSASNHAVLIVLVTTESHYITTSRGLHVWAATIVVAAVSHGFINAGAWIRGHCTEASAISTGATISSLLALSFAWPEEATRSLVHIWMMC